MLLRIRYLLISSGGIGDGAKIIPHIVGVLWVAIGCVKDNGQKVCDES